MLNLFAPFAFLLFLASSFVGAAAATEKVAEPAATKRTGAAGARGGNSVLRAIANNNRKTKNARLSADLADAGQSVLAPEDEKYWERFLQGSPAESIPSAGPSASPSASPSNSPSTSPSASPSASPSGLPSAGPSDSPSSSPSDSPSAGPSASPSDSPSAGPSASPSDSPSASPSASPTEACDLDVSIECSTDAATFDKSSDCNNIIPIVTRCDLRADEMKFKYNGGDCDQSYTIQDSDKFVCKDGQTSPSLTDPAYVVLVSDDLAEVYFNGTMTPGEVFCAKAPADGDGFDADSVLYVYPNMTAAAEEPPTDSSTWPDNSNPPYNLTLQVVQFHTSCSSDLFLKDKYGSAQLVEFANANGTFSCFVDATLSVTLTNEGSSANEIVEFTSALTDDASGTATDDCLDDLPGGNTTLAPNVPVVVEKNITLDMTVEQDYLAEVYLAVSTPGNRTCNDSDSTSWTAGNPEDVPLTASPTKSPHPSAIPTSLAPTIEIPFVCLLCPEGGSVQDPDAAVDFGGDDDLTCGELEEALPSEVFDETACEAIRSNATACICPGNPQEDTPFPTASPSTSPSEAPTVAPGRGRGRRWLTMLLGI